MRFSIIFTGQTSNDSTGNSKLPASVCKYCRESHYMQCSVISKSIHVMFMWRWLLNRPDVIHSVKLIMAPPTGFFIRSDLDTVTVNGSMIQPAPGFPFKPAPYWHLFTNSIFYMFLLVYFFTFYFIVNDEEGEEKAGLGNVMSRTCLYEHAIPNYVFHVIFLVSGFSLV